MSGRLGQLRAALEAAEAAEAATPQQQQMHRGGGANYTGAVVVKPAVTAAQRQPVAQHGYISQPQPVAQHGYIGAPAAQNMMQVVYLESFGQKMEVGILWVGGFSIMELCMSF